VENINKTISPYMYRFVVKNVNLAEYMETEAGCVLKWYEPGISAGSICPLPNHGDKKPSFRIKYVEEDGLWIFHCFGCNAKGNIIDFCKAYHGLKSSREAVKMLCEKFGFKDEQGKEFSLLDDIYIKKYNLKKKVECANIVTSNLCRILLRKNYKEHNKWVAQSYRKIDEALDKDDLDAIEMIGFEAFNKTRE